MQQVDRNAYKHFIIWAAPYRLADSGEWKLTVNILRKSGDIVKTFHGNTFKTQEEAISASLRYGKLIIDGMIPGCSV